MKHLNPVELSVFKNRFASICDEMGVTLCRSSFSPNIKERQDFSCAIFDAQGSLVAQAAHIPVHLGSMALSVQAALAVFKLQEKDSVILNDPYSGGTHLPDITLVEPVFLSSQASPTFFVANRAHHSDVGGQSPGSMPLSDHLEQEGVVIPPTRLTRRGRLNEKWLQGFLQQVRTPAERRADLLAQQAANQMGVRRLKELSETQGLKKTLQAMHDYQDYERRISLNALKKIPKGNYRFTDTLDDDGMGTQDIPISVHLKVLGHKLVVDLRDSADQVRGPVNATFAITLSAVAYVLRCLVYGLTGEDCASMKVIHLKTRPGTVVDAQFPAPVAGGNVETSQRIVDVLFGALAQALPQLIPAASQGTMNNLAVGSKDFTYYETMAGGVGAGPNGSGENAMHSHMTNTLNTPIEALETELPLRITRYQLRRGSGGKGRHRGGMGLIREYEFLKPAQASLLTERRQKQPYGLQGGEPGRPGQNYFIDAKGKTRKLPAKTELKLKAGEGLGMKTPGGGGWGRKSS